VLVLGRREALPADVPGFTQPEPHLPIYFRDALGGGMLGAHTEPGNSARSLD
jgi:hypothetical protein